MDHQRKMDEESVYFVDEIIDKRDSTPSTEYLVKWTGWPTKYNTWEPSVNIIDTGLIDAYEERQTIKRFAAECQKNQQRTVTSQGLDFWPIPGLSCSCSTDNDLTNKPATEVDGEKATAAKEEVKKDVGTKTYQSKPRTAKSAQKVKQVKLDKKSVKKTAKELKKLAAKSKVPAKKMKTRKALARSG